MKKTNRALAFVLLTVLLVASVATLVSCGGAKDAIEGYQLSITTVKDDFTLPREIGEGVKVNWKSDNDAIKIIKRRGEDYLAQVTLADTVQQVKLTVSATGGGSKDFVVTVQALNAMLFANEYVFPQEGLEVSQDFDLAQDCENRGKKATITWSVDEKYQQYISVENNSKCVVSVPADTTKVELKGTFKYNGGEATKPFTFYVAQPKDHREEVDYWYNNASFTMNVSGYVTGIATPYDSSYSNATFYIVDDDMCAGYYLYRSKSASATDGENLKVGAHVTVTGVLSSDYNGLMEAAAGSIFTVDTDIAAKTPAELVYNLDNDVTSGSPSVKWHTGALVKLTNWKVKSITDASTKKAATLVTLTKDGKDITIGYNNYMEGFYTSADDKPSAELTAIKTEMAKYKVDDVVTVTGILSYYSPNFQILPRSASDIVAGTADANPTAGSKVAAAITAVNDALKTAGIIDSNGAVNFITSPIEEATLPTNVGGVAISYRETFDGSATVIANGKISVTPQSKLQNTTVEVTYEVDGYKTWTFFKVRSQSLDDAGKVAYVVENLANEFETNYDKAQEVKLPVDETFGLNIVWSIEETNVTYASIVGNKTLKITLPKEESTFTLVATISSNGASDTLKIKIKVAAAPNTVVEFTALDAAKTGTYKLHMYQENLKLDLYANGQMDGYYYGTTEDTASAADFVIAEATGGYTIKNGAKFVEIVPRTDGSTGINVVFNATQTEGKVWKWNDTIKTFTMMSGNNSDAAEVEYFLGTSGTYKTFSANKVSDASSKYVGQFGTLEEYEIGSLKYIKAPVAGVYVMGMYQGTLKKYQFVDGTQDTSGRLNTTDDATKAAKVTLAASGDGWTIKIGDKFLELKDPTDNNATIALNDAQTSGLVWKWNATVHNFTMTLGEGETAKTYYLGTYNNFTTLSASNLSFITGDNASKVDVSQFIGRIGKVVGAPEAEEPEEPDPETNYGSEDAPISVEAALAIAAAQCKANNDVTKEIVYVTGKVITKTDTSGSFIKQFTLADINNPSKTIIVYSMNKTAGIADPDQNDTIILKGYIKNYSGTIEFATNGSTYVTLLNNTRGQSTITLGEHDGATVTGMPSDVVTNGSEITITVTPAEGKYIHAVYYDGVEIDADAEGGNEYTFTVHGNATLKVEAYSIGAEPDTRLELNVGTIGTAQNWIDGNTSDAPKYSSLPTGDNNVTVEAVGTGNNGKYYTSDKSWRFYKNGDGALKITVGEGYELVSVTVTFTTGSFAGLTSNEEYTVKETEKQSVSFTVESNLRVTAIVVVYRVAD